jgi:hypothetical protein
MCPFQAQQSALRDPLIPIEAPYTPSSSLFLASSPSYRPSKIHGPRKFTNQPQTKKSASSRIYARFKPNKVHCVLPRYLTRRPVPHLLHFCLRFCLQITPQRWLSCVYHSDCCVVSNGFLAGAFLCWGICVRKNMDQAKSTF